MEAKQDRICKSGLKVLEVLEVLSRNFYHGFSSTELQRETGFSASDINSYVNTLITAGFAERIQETNRIRPSTKFARIALQIMRALEAAESKLKELKTRIFGDGNGTN